MRARRKKQASRMKLDLSTAIAEGPTEMLMMPVTTLETKKAPPRILLRPTSPSLEPVKEIMLEKTSEAPFPSERRETPWWERVLGFWRGSQERDRSSQRRCCRGDRRGERARGGERRKQGLS